MPGRVLLLFYARAVASWFTLGTRCCSHWPCFTSYKTLMNLLKSQLKGTRTIFRDQVPLRKHRGWPLCDGVGVGDCHVKQSRTRNLLPPRGSLARPPAPHPLTLYPLLLLQSQCGQWAHSDIVSACAGRADGGRGGGASLPACPGPSSSLAPSSILAFFQGAPGCSAGNEALAQPSWTWAVITRATSAAVLGKRALEEEYRPDWALGRKGDRPSLNCRAG